MDNQSVKLGLTKRQFLLGVAAGSLPLSPGFAWAQKQTSVPAMPSASPWAKASHSELRLLASGQAIAAGHYHAGIAVQMKLGFKTYWRHPGDSGVPPVFHFEGSQNLAHAEILYPAPQKFADGAGGHSFGYHESNVIFPLLVKAQDPSKPVLLRLKADYAVCDTICIPAHGEASLMLSGALDDQNVELLRAAHAKVPERVKMGQAMQAIAIHSIKRDVTPEHFLVEVQLPRDMQADLFIEGESPWFFETKSLNRQDGDRATYLISVIERSKAADCTGVDITMTLVARDDHAKKMSIEVTTRLDLAMVTH